MSLGTHEALLVLRREVRLEVAGREALVITAPYAFVLVILVGLGLDRRPDLLEPLAPTLTWLIVLTVAAPLARVVSAAEHDDGSWDLLRALVSPGALLAGKALFVWLLLAIVWLLAAVLAVVVLAAPWQPWALAAAVPGTLGLALNTTALGLLLGNTARGGGLLAALVLPAGVPLLLAGTRVAQSVAISQWMTLLLVYDVVLAVVLWAVSPLLLDT